jgi:hypothetical protein
MKFGFIAKHRGIWPVLWMCEALGVSRGGFYAWLTRPRSQRSRDDDELSAKVRANFLGSDRTYGARRVWRDLLTEGISCGLHRIERLMRLQALKARPRRRRLPARSGGAAGGRRGTQRSRPQLGCAGLPAQSLKHGGRAADQSANIGSSPPRFSACKLAISSRVQVAHLSLVNPIQFPVFDLALCLRMVGAPRTITLSGRVASRFFRSAPGDRQRVVGASPIR